jgi:hypothetical protein
VREKCLDEGMKFILKGRGEGRTEEKKQEKSRQVAFPPKRSHSISQKSP